MTKKSIAIDDLATSVTLFTTDYSMFRFIAENREVHLSTKVKESLTNLGWMKSSPMIVNQHHEVIDGQNRLKWAQELGIGVYYLTIRTRDREHDMQIVRGLNNGQRPWQVADSIHSNAASGTRCYQQFIEFQERHKFNHSNSMYIFFEGGSRQSDAIKTNQPIKVNSDADKVATFLHSLRDLSFWNTAPFVRAVVMLHKRKLSQKLLDRIQHRRMQITECRRESQYLAVFENLINYGVPGKKRISLQALQAA